MGKLIYLFACAFVCSSAIPAEDVPSISNRISHGNQANETQFRYAVSIQSTAQDAQQSATRGHVCGGALVTLQHVLTAATCTYTKYANGTMVPIVPAQYRVFAGANLLTSDTAERVRNIANYTRHPDYIAGPAHFNDIAIITLQAPFLATTVSPLSLPSTNFAPAEFTSCVVAGWGSSAAAQSTPSPNLLYANKYVYNQALCTNVFNPATQLPNIFPSMICAASYNIISSNCVGDEGNALVCGGTLTGVAFLTNNCQASSHPELYTRVSNYTTWIRSFTGDASTFTPGLFTLTLFIFLHVS